MPAGWKYLLQHFSVQMQNDFRRNKSLWKLFDLLFWKNTKTLKVKDDLLIARTTAIHPFIHLISSILLTGSRNPDNQDELFNLYRKMFSRFRGWCLRIMLVLQEDQFSTVAPECLPRKSNTGELWETTTLALHIIEAFKMFRFQLVKKLRNWKITWR